MSEDMQTSDWIIGAVAAVVLAGVAWFIASAMGAHPLLTIGLMALAALVAIGKTSQAATKREQAARADEVNRRQLGRQ
mgnify:CR=1 FL=1